MTDTPIYASRSSFRTVELTDDLVTWSLPASENRMPRAGGRANDAAIIVDGAARWRIYARKTCPKRKESSACKSA